MTTSSTSTGTGGKPRGEPARQETLEELRERIRRSRTRRLPLLSAATPMVVSIAIHAAILLTTAVVVWRIAAEPYVPPPVVISFDAPGPVAPPSTGAPVPAAEAAMPLPSLLAPATAAIGSAERPVFESASTLAPGAAPGVGEAVEIETGASLFASPSVAAPATDLTGDGPTVPVAGRDVGFAGLGASSVRSVVYVVDASGPMVTSLPVVLSEVERSVSRLAPSQKFSVILCRETGDGAPDLRMFPPVPVRATPRAVGELSRWLAAAAPQGRSAPLRGLEAALGMKPDAVFLLSRAIDRTGGGEWGQGLEATMNRLEQLNPTLNRAGRRAVVIKTIQFLDEDPTGIMQAIGRAHGGPEAAGATAGDAGYRVVRRNEDLEVR